MKLTLLSAEDLRRALPMGEAIEAMKDAFAALSTGEATVPQRAVIPVPSENAVSLTMPAFLTGQGLGAKLVSVFPNNTAHGKPVINGLVVALDPTTGEPVALADGTFLTAWRTGAASGAATDVLARPRARTAAIIGCGAQARTQLLAIAAVRALEEVRVYARTTAAVGRFVEEMQPQVQARLVVTAGAREAVEGAEVICAATTSKSPVFRGGWLAEGTHINGVGSYTTEMQEIDTATVARARIFVDQQEAALEEAGDLVIAEREGHTQRDQWTELGEVIAGQSPGRRTGEEITFWKSVGVAVQDIAALAQALRGARKLGLGKAVEF